MPVIMAYGIPDEQGLMTNYGVGHMLRRSRWQLESISVSTRIHVCICI